MQQRASICRALIHEPKMLLLDEPFGALDAFTREELWYVLRDLWTAQRFNVILVTHDLREAVYLADTVYVMSGGPGASWCGARSSCRARATSSSPTQGVRRHRPRAARADRRDPQAADAEPRGDRAMTRCDKERWAPWLLLIARCCSGNCLPRLNVSEFIFPAPSASPQPWNSRPIAWHAWRTFWVTMVGFGLSIVVGACWAS